MSPEPEPPRAPAVGALGLALALVGIGFDIPPSLVAGVGLLILAVGAAGWVELASRGGVLEREPAPRRVIEGTSYPLRIRLRGTLLPPPGGLLSDPLLSRPLAVGPRWARRMQRAIVVRGPGPRKLGEARLLIRDPLGLWSRELHSARQVKLLVLPRIEAVRSVGGDGESIGTSAGAGERPRSHAVGTADLEVDGLRPYRQGSPASRIHWPSVARSGEMIERRMSGGEGGRPLVVLDLRGGSGGRDRAMRAAASLCVALARSGGCELLLPGERRTLAVDPELRAWPEVHTRIALAADGGAAAPASALRGGAVIWVSATGPPSRVRALLAPGSFLVSPTRGGGEVAFQVAGCDGVAVSSNGRGLRSGGTRAAA